MARRKLFSNKTKGAFQNNLIKNVINIVLEHNSPSKQRPPEGVKRRSFVDTLFQEAGTDHPSP